MSETIFALYNDEKFDKLLFYLKENGIFTLDALSSFDFNELRFVPGVQEELILEAKQLYLLYSTSHPIEVSLLPESSNIIPDYTDINTIKYVTSAQKELDIYSKAVSNCVSELIKDVNVSNPDVFFEKKEKMSQPNKKINDALIVDVYSNIPRSSSFISKCTSGGKTLMSQLTEEDFENAVNLRGIGQMSAENLKKIYLDFIDSPHLTDCGAYNTSLSDSKSMKSIEDLPLSVRARNCLLHSGITSLDSLLALSEEDLITIKNLGKKSFDEILAFKEKILLAKMDQSKLYYLRNINPENKPIPIHLFKNINLGLSKKDLDMLQENNIRTLGDLCDVGLSPKQHLFVSKKIEGFFSIPVSLHFANAVEALRDNAKFSMRKRSQGATLEEIGRELQITRERVRQIIAKACRSLIGIAELVVGTLLSTDYVSFYYSTLVELFRSEELAMYCKLVLQESKYLRYIKFSDSFIKSSVCGTDVEERLITFANEIIGEGINYYDNLELIEFELKKHDLGFFDALDIMNFLIHNGYRFYGDYVASTKRRYAPVCHDAILKFFDLDIKLDSDENNEDMRLLRKIISKHYPGLSLPLNNKALTSGMTRDSSKLILSGRGRYCPIEKVIYSVNLFEEIHSFINNSPQSSFYYSELFSIFQGRLLAETNIDNSHFLHGMLKCLYPDEFVYERDLLSKIGENRQNIDERLIQMLLENGRAMSRAEIKRSISGINDYVISFSVMRVPGLIQWDYNEFNHIDNIKICDEECLALYNIIKDQAELHNGYLSDILLFKATKNVCKDFLSRNNILNPSNLYYVTMQLFEGYYRFRKPHILSNDFPVQNISATNIVQVLLPCEINLSYEDFYNLATKLGWARGTLNAIFKELEKDFVRISENDYVRKKYFNISQSLVSMISDLLNGFVSKSGYFAFSSIFDYDSFPECVYKWNGFLLESIITEYETGFRILSPQLRDRRYQRGIIVSDTSPFETFEDLIIGNLIADGISTLSESEFLKYLKMRALVDANKIPQELYECRELSFKNELFTLRK